MRKRTFAPEVISLDDPSGDIGKPVESGQQCVKRETKEACNVVEPTKDCSTQPERKSEKAQVEAKLANPSKAEVAVETSGKSAAAEAPKPTVDKPKDRENTSHQAELLKHVDGLCKSVLMEGAMTDKDIDLQINKLRFLAQKKGFLLMVYALFVFVIVFPELMLFFVYLWFLIVTFMFSLILLGWFWHSELLHLLQRIMLRLSHCLLL